MKYLQLTVIFLALCLIQPAPAETKDATAETKDATEAPPSTSSLEVIKSLSEAVKSLSETVKMLSEPAIQTGRAPAKEAKEEAPSAITSPSKRGLTFHGEFDEDFMPIQLDFNLPKFKTGKGPYQIDVQNVAFHFQVNANNPQGLALSKGYFKVGHFNFDLSLLGLQTTLDKLDITANSELQDNLVHYSLHTQLGKLFVPKAVTGDKDLELSFEGQMDVHHIEATALLALQNMVREMSKQLRDGTASEEEIETQLTTKFLAVIPQLLTHSPEISIPTWKLATSAGEFQGTASIKIDGNKPLELAAEDQLKDSLIEALQVQAEFQIAKELLTELLMQDMEDQDDVAEQIQAWVEQKFLVFEADDNTYSSVISLQEGKLIINGMVEDLRQHPLKAKVKQVVDFLTRLQTPAEEYLQSKGSFPPVEEITEETTNEYVADVVSNPEQFYFQATLKKESDGVEPEIAGKTVRLTFDPESGNWSCGPGEPEGIDPQYLPDECQPDE